MLLSVVIPVFNRSTELERCLRSVERLFCYDIAEVVVVDDGSSLEESRCVDFLIKQFSNSTNLRCLHIEHRGASAARNVGAVMAKGKYLWFVDADDEANSDCFPQLEEVLKSLSDSCDILVTGGLNGLLGQNEESQIIAFPQMLKVVSRAPIHTVFPDATNHTLCFIKHEWLMQNTELLYPEDMSVLEDTQFILRLLAAAKQVVHNPSIRPYRLHRSPVSTTSGAWSEQRSSSFINDICRFFVFLRQYADNEITYDLYRCYRFVYLRTLAVKGCPWKDIMQLRSTVQMTDPFTLFERLLFCAPIHKAIAFLCRLVRTRR